MHSPALALLPEKTGDVDTVADWLWSNGSSCVTRRISLNARPPGHASGQAAYSERGEVKRAKLDEVEEDGVATSAMSAGDTHKHAEDGCLNEKRHVSFARGSKMTTLAANPLAAASTWYVPCAADDPDVVGDVRLECLEEDQLLLPPVTRCHFVEALKCTIPSATVEEIAQYEEWRLQTRSA